MWGTSVGRWRKRWRKEWLSLLVGKGKHQQRGDPWEQALRQQRLLLVASEGWNQGASCMPVKHCGLLDEFKRMSGTPSNNRRFGNFDITDTMTVNGRRRHQDSDGVIVHWRICSKLCVFFSLFNCWLAILVPSIVIWPKRSSDNSWLANMHLDPIHDLVST